MRTLEKLGVYKALTDEFGYRGPSGIPQIFRYDNRVLLIWVLINLL
jgi:salicylate hydroxylase